MTTKAINIQSDISENQIEEEKKNNIDPKLLAIGKPVSGKSWKKLSQKSSNKEVKIGGLNQSYEWKKKQRDEEKELKKRVAELNAEATKRKQQQRKAQEEKKKRKEENTIKSSTYQLIKNSTKIRKWKKKAQAGLMKLPSSMFEKLIKKEYNY